MLPIGHSVRIGLATKQHSKTDKKLSDMCYRTMGYDFDSAINQPEKIITKELQNYSSSNSSKLDKYQQIFKTETARATGNHLKASVKVLLAEQKHQSFLQVLHDNQVTLAGRKSFFTINIRTQPSSLQINCSNCYSRNPKIKKNDRENYRWCRWNQKYTSRGRSSNNGKSNDFAGKSLLAGIPTCHIQTNITNATGIDKNNFRHQENLYNVCMERSFAYLTLCISNIARSVVPVTMSAAILSSLSTTLGAGYQYMAQHYKQYSQSFSFYAASSVILMLCYLTTPSAAAATQSETVAIDKHPIIDWSKFDESSSDKEILDLLLEKKRYDKRLLPPVNDEDFCCGLQSPDMATIHNERRAHNRGTLTVNVNVLLLSLASPDESSLKYEVEFLLNQQWNDPRLQYGNKSHYDFLNALHHHDSIWTPDTYFIMHGDFKDPIIPMHFALRIFRNGTITYAMRRHLILSCQGSLHIFPFDDPKCSFSMESISYEEAQIKYVWKNDEDTLRKSPSLTTLNAYLIKNQTTACDQNSWRGVTTMLNFFTTSNGFRSTLPVVSNLTAMNVWDGVCMCFIYASLLEFVCVNYVGRKRPLHNVVYRPGENPVTQRLPAVLSRIGVILASPLASAIGTSEMINAPLPMNVAASKFIAGTGLRETETEFLSGMRWQDAHGGIIGAAVQNLRARSIKHKSGHQITTAASSKLAATLSSVSTLSTENVYHEPETDKNRTNVIVTSIKLEDIQEKELSPMLRRSIATSTPALVVRIDQEKLEDNEEKLVEQPVDNRRQLNMPLKPPRKKSSRSNSPNSIYVTDMESDMNNRIKTAAAKAEAPVENPGEKRRDAGAPNEIVACTTCGSSNSPCTHSVNNGCATETCFVQMRKKEPPHPIRVAKTIDVIARITFPTAYATFLIFFFVHYKGFS
ncbi:uncharacterized protein LOC6583656 isoform X14 [Drosophila mojavensis]|uniref:uncharacterized protein LOC6583656 isoform X14 n=1 Tax=Drosophila mojavensis TaxID=7230 RepID=UPI0013EEA528|nr:uncharacterized protein LOC6583656 isoform X14 [Drosophila mojavensis]